MKNANGIDIKPCCASCIHKKFKNEERRYCDAGEGDIYPSDCCSLYKMRVEFYEAAGDRKKQGRVRKKAWLDWIFKYRLKEQREEDEHKITIYQRASLAELVREWESLHGTRIAFK